MDHLAEQIMQSVRTGFIDGAYESREELRPKLIYNDYRKGNTVLANLEKELNDCDSFWLSVAFITKSGLIVLKETLKELRDRGIKGKILTTDYLAFNEPGALRELREFNNISVRVFTKENFHTKGYMFRQDKQYTFVVGSSNLTQNALKSNKEWNLRVTSLENGEMIRETLAEFNLMWNQAEVLDEEWIQDYEKIYWENKRITDHQKLVRIKTHTLKPNSMQVDATRALDRLRSDGKDKALLISATGTGKTYVSTFALRELVFKKYFLGSP